MTPNCARKINILFIFMICTPLIGAYFIQFVKGEFPCPLCLLQRLAMVGIACGAINDESAIRNSPNALRHVHH